jgi:uncharacterized protein YegP (UPF0339 family)
MNSPRWVIERGRWPHRRWRVSLVAANGRKVVTSGDGYQTRRAALEAVEFVRQNVDAPTDDDHS